mmetsp:Transcript_1609/g.4390  ORF Transcript_1609/g.4390 Transcript_1609/m.4390 type:complete len:226 (+) Transcript_1609:589-1266(+)
MWEDKRVCLLGLNVVGHLVEELLDGVGRHAVSAQHRHHIQILFQVNEYVGDEAPLAQSEAHVEASLSRPGIARPFPQAEQPLGQVDGVEQHVILQQLLQQGVLFEEDPHLEDKGLQYPVRQYLQVEETPHVLERHTHQIRHPVTLQLIHPLLALAITATTITFPGCCRCCWLCWRAESSLVGELEDGGVWGCLGDGKEIGVHDLQHHVLLGQDGLLPHELQEHVE